jgi:hypothetical protein
MNPIHLIEVYIVNQVWDSILKLLFGHQSLPYIEAFGNYLFYRQQVLYKANHRVLRNVYKDRTKKYYEFKLKDKSYENLQQIDKDFRETLDKIQ